ncbi:MAG: hypothetical protein ACE5HF_11175 [Gemmatimonadota bacterium]
MKSRGRTLAVIALAVPLASGRALAQGVTLRPVTGEAGVDFDGAWIAFPSTPSTNRRTFQQWIQVNLGGSVVDPRLLDFSLGLRPLRSQTAWGGFPSSPSGGLDGLDGSASVRLLGGAPVSLALAGSRATIDNRGRFGSRTDEVRSGWESRLRFRNPYMPGEIHYSDRSRDLTWRPDASQAFREADRVRTLEVTARSRKTGAVFERLSFDDRVGLRDFIRYRAILDHHVRWGKGSRVISSFQWVRRTGFTAYENRSWAQRIHLQHTRRVGSDWEYHLFSQEAGPDFTRGGDGEVAARVAVASGLEASVEGYGQWTRFRVGRQSYYRVRPRLSLAANLPLGFELLADGAVGYEWHDQEPTEAGFASIVGELHVLGASRRFQLDEAFAEAASVELSSADGTRLFQNQVDYRLVETGPFVEVLALPGGRLVAGDSVVADYRFRIVPGATTNSWVSDYGVEARTGGLRLYARRSVQDATRDIDPGLLPTLRNYDDVTAGAGLDLPVGSGALDLQVEHRRRRADTFDFRNTNLRGGYSVLLGGLVQVRFGGGASLRRGGTAPFDLVEGESSLEWGATRDLRLRASFSVWRWTEDGREERFAGGGLGGDWLVGLLRLQFRYDRVAWRDGFDRSENRLVVRAVRTL